jgi:DNA replication protein DnaC
MNLDHHLIQQLKLLRLGGMLQTLDLRLDQAQKNSLGYVEFLALLVQDEIERREGKKLSLRLSQACFEEEKTLEGFNFSFNPKLNGRLIRDLGTTGFISKREHVLLYGPAGVGKSHVAQALGHQACRLGHDVLFTKAAKLFRFLLAGRADHSWEKRIKKYLAPDLLIIDDFGLATLTAVQAEDFYEIVAERHQGIHHCHQQPSSPGLDPPVPRPGHGQLCPRPARSSRSSSHHGRRLVSAEAQSQR